jgi:hypothetical protein
MARPAGRTRGVRDIRTHSRAPGETLQPHKGYMRIAALELEVFRRGQERQSAMSRVQSIDQRFREIETEQALILKGIKTRKAGEDPRRALDAPSESPRAGFKLRY